MSQADRVAKRRKDAQKPSCEAMAAWLFDHGLGHVDEPRVAINHLPFYASDFLPENQQRLKQKCESIMWQTNITEDGRMNILDLGASWRKRPELDKQTLNVWVGKARKTDHGRLFIDAETLKELLEALAEGTLSFFTDDAISAQRQLQWDDRAYLIHHLAKLPPDILEYVIRNTLSVHVNAFYDDELERTKYTEKEGYDTTYRYQKRGLNSGSHALIISQKGINADVTVGGVSDSNAWQHWFYHEVAHHIFKLHYSLNREEFDALAHAITTCQETFPSQHDPLIIENFCSTIADLTMFSHHTGSLKNYLFPSPQNYPDTTSRQVEVMCDMLALSFGALEGNKGEQLLREHYPNHPEFVEAIIALRDTVRDIFNQRLEGLRAKNPLPPALSQANIVI